MKLRGRGIFQALLLGCLGLGLIAAATPTATVTIDAPCTPVFATPAPEIEHEDGPCPDEVACLCAEALTDDWVITGVPSADDACRAFERVDAGLVPFARAAFAMPVPTPDGGAGGGGGGGGATAVVWFRGVKEATPAPAGGYKVVPDKKEVKWVDKAKMGDDDLIKGGAEARGSSVNQDKTKLPPQAPTGYKIVELPNTLEIKVQPRRNQKGEVIDEKHGEIVPKQQMKWKDFVAECAKIKLEKAP